MRLNNAIIMNMELNGQSVVHTKEFIYGLRSAKDLVADVYLNTNLLFTCKPVIKEENCWLIVYVDGRFALSEEKTIESVLIRVHQSGSDVVILESLTAISDIISEGDIDADLNFAVISTTPYSTMKCNLPESRFKPLHHEVLAAIDLDDQPSANPEEVEVEDPGD